MRITPPLTIGASQFTDTNVLETVPTAYDAGTTYDAGDTASVAGDYNAHTVYESLAGSNTGNTPASSPAWWREKGTVYGAYSGGTTYYPGDIATDTTNHLLYESLWQDIGEPRDDAGNENTGNALTNTTYWQEVGPSGAWAAFDGTTNYRTTWNDEITVELTVSGLGDTIGLLNMSGITDINLVATEDAVEILDQDYDLIDGVASWWSWLFDPLQTKADLTITDLVDLDVDPEAELVLALTFTGPDALSIGEIVCGKSRLIGATQKGLRLGIIDYSKIDEDDFGVRSIVQRDYAKRMDAEVWVDADDTSYVFALLTARRAAPSLFTATEVHAAATQYGIVKSWRENLQFPSHSILLITCEGL